MSQSILIWTSLHSYGSFLVADEQQKDSETLKILQEMLADAQDLLELRRAKAEAEEGSV
jgi:hypothetical protein